MLRTDSESHLGAGGQGLAHQLQDTAVIPSIIVISLQSIPFAAALSAKLWIRILMR